MARLLLIGAFVAVALMVVAIVDVAMIESRRVRALPKWGWILVCLIPVIGPVLWFLLGRERPGRGGRPASRPMAPDDDIEFLGRISREQREQERIADLERRLRELDDDDKKG